jgi:hypothetical protein
MLVRLKVIVRATALTIELALNYKWAPGLGEEEQQYLCFATWLLYKARG